MDIRGNIIQLDPTDGSYLLYMDQTVKVYVSVGEQRLQSGIASENRTGYFLSRLTIIHTGVNFPTVLDMSSPFTLVRTDLPWKCPGFTVATCAHTNQPYISRSLQVTSALEIEVRMYHSEELVSTVRPYIVQGDPAARGLSLSRSLIRPSQWFLHTMETSVR